MIRPLMVANRDWDALDGPGRRWAVLACVLLLPYGFGVYVAVLKLGPDGFWGWLVMVALLAIPLEVCIRWLVRRSGPR